MATFAHAVQSLELEPDYRLTNTGARPTNDISIKIRLKFAALWFKIFSTDNNEILPTSRQLHVRRISLWSDKHILN